MNSYIAYRIIRVSDMGWRHGSKNTMVSCMGGLVFRHGCGGETVYHEMCIYDASCTAVALQSIHLF